jgi:Ca2+-binding EF-hand superfamily protein
MDVQLIITVNDVFITYIKQLFDIDPNGNISEHMLKSIIQNYNNTAPDGIGRQESAGVARSTNDNNDSERVQLKFDKFALLKKFDRDEDGGIGREDFIRVPEKQKLFTSPAAMINNVLQAFMQVKKH